MRQMKLDSLLAAAKQHNASDLHLIADINETHSCVSGNRSRDLSPVELGFLLLHIGSIGLHARRQLGHQILLGVVGLLIENRLVQQLLIPSE